MTTNFISVPDNYSVKQAMKSVIDQAAENDNISTIYATDEQGAFRGAIDLRDLVIARSTQDLKEIITESYPYVYAAEDIADCIEKLKEYSEDSIPVLDNENRILGVITSADIVEAVDEEMGEDYAKLGGLTEEEDLSESTAKSVRKRLPWLIILLFLGRAYRRWSGCRSRDRPGWLSRFLSIDDSRHGGQRGHPVSGRDDPRAGRRRGRQDDGETRL